MNPESSNTPQLCKLLRFHLREIAADLKGIGQRLSTLSGHEGGVVWAHRDGLADAVSVLEHVSDHHLGEIHRLVAGELAGDVRMAHPVESVPPPPPDPLALGQQQRGLVSGIQCCAHEVDGLLASLASLEENDEALAGFADSIGHLLVRTRKHLVPLANQLHVAVVVFYQQDNPEEARQGEEDQLRADPMRELPHREAKELRSCPYCQAPLNDDDRTMDGSFCENCGTRWIPRRSVAHPASDD